ncbi:DUF2950 family protein [Caballeronia sp. INML2]|uniref:DUF2950 family protein n=1 Tax=Caballeronia sp. INML2 TaxID=2921748 RepID=UPI0039064936
MHSRRCIPRLPHSHPRRQAPGGAFSYAINGGMLAGFAMGLYPVQYGRSGAMAFIVSNNGGVCQKDRGKS